MAERRISAAGFHFKGSGFYITDYGKDGKKAEREAAKAKSEKPAAEVKSGEAAGASDSKPAESAAPKKEAAPAPVPAAGTTKKKE